MPAINSHLKTQFAFSPDQEMQSLCIKTGLYQAMGVLKKKTPAFVYAVISSMLLQQESLQTLKAS